MFSFLDFVHSIVSNEFQLFKLCAREDETIFILQKIKVEMAQSTRRRPTSFIIYWLLVIGRWLSIFDFLLCHAMQDQ